MDRRWTTKISVLVCGFSLIIGTSIFLGTPGGASGVTLTTSPDQVLPNPPALGASNSDWQAWSAEQRSAVESTDWAQVLSTDQCQVVQSSIQSITSDGLIGIPQGIVTDAVSGVSTCNHAE